ncbi:MAG: hypothetical protein F4Y14_14805 [Acidobacteria bacterium]|nr:hypothetical protein [Acidobacteriota bacterium]
MAAATAIFNQHSDVRVEHGALIFPMPVECYDRLMDSESLPRGSSYNGPRRTLEVDAAPNGRYHDPRAFAIAELLTELRRASNVPAHVGATAPVEGGEDDRRHPDAQLFVSPAKLKALETAVRPAPVPDVVVEIDTTPLSRERFEARLAAHRRLGVPELWAWSRTGGSEARPEGAASIFVAGQDGWRESEESAAVPGLRPTDLEVLLQEPNDIAPARAAEELAARLEPD